MSKTKLVCLMLCVIAWSAVDSVARAEKDAAKKQSPPLTKSAVRVERDKRNQVLITTIAYLLRTWKPKKEPWLCAISSEAGGFDTNADKDFLQELQRMGAMRVPPSWSWPNSSPRPKDFYFLTCEKVEWITPKRAKVTLYLATDGGEYVTEAHGLFYLDRSRNAWTVDARHSKTITGD